MRRSRLFGRITCASICALATLAAPALAADPPRQVPVGTGFEAPIYATGPSGDSRRVFVVERGGTIRVVLDGRTLAQPFLRIPGGVATAGEQGLLSMAFHPGYASNRRFYVFYADPETGAIRIDEFRRDPASANRALAGSRRRVMTIPHPGATNHYGGQLQFRSNGHLYISTGDGGGANDPENDAQRGNSLLGKLLRINPLPSGDRSYTIPRGNPFVGLPPRDEIFAYGLRNPHRFSFDRQTGNLWIGDVGQSTAEEIDFLAAGARFANFGWNCFEGFGRTPGVQCEREPTFYVPPVLEHRHTNQPCDSITGGYVARTPTLSSVAGRYVYGDYCNGQVRLATRHADGGVTSEPWFSFPPTSLVSFGEDGVGRLYAVLIAEGTVYRLVDRSTP
jgi:glucose/arabinose dehydrogenase